LLLLLLLMLMLLQDDCCEVHHVHSRLPLNAVALGDDGVYVIAYDDGASTWSVISDKLHKTLNNTLKRNGRGVAFVSLGRNQGSDSYDTAVDPDDVYFVRRNTGTTYLGAQCADKLRDQWWNGEDDERVVKVSFAPSNGWYAFERGGGATYEGLPASLKEHLDEYWQEYDGVQALSVGHNGEWFVKYVKGGAYASSGVHPALYKLLHTETGMSRTGAVEWVELGPDGTFVALFERYTAWYGFDNLTDALLSCM
jgi:hypothetical protein